MLNSKATHLQQSRKGGGRPRNQPVMSGLDMNAVIRHEARKDQLAVFRCGLDEVERQSRFARARGPANEDGPRPRQNRRGVNGGWSVHQRLHRRQPNDKARAKNPLLENRIVTLGVVAGVPRGHAVLRLQPAVMRLHDLLGDRQAKTRVLTEILLRPVSIEPLEDFLDRVRPDAGAVVIDCDQYFAARTPTGDPHRAARRGERAPVVNQIVDNLAEPGIMTLYSKDARR